MEYDSVLKSNETWNDEEIGESYMHFTKWKQPIWKGYIGSDSDPMRFWKRQNSGGGKRWWLPRVERSSRGEEYRARSVQWAHISNTPMVDTYLHSFTPTECTTQAWTPGELRALGDLTWQHRLLPQGRCPGGLTVGEAIPVGGHKVHRKPQYICLGFLRTWVRWLKRRKSFKNQIQRHEANMYKELSILDKWLP